MKRGSVVLLFIIALVVGAITGIIIDRSQVAQLSGDRKQSGDKLNWTLSMLENQYVDSLSRDSLANMVIPMLLSNLDPHSEYISADQFKAMNEPLAGKFDGIGVIFNMATDTAIILNVIPGGPSSAEGLVAGDRIITIDGENVAGVKKDQMKVVGMLRGEKNTKVALGVKRGEKPALLPFTITRGEIPIHSLEASFLTADKAAYVRVSRFAATTHTEVVNALQNMIKNGATSVVIDIRGNGGGYLDQAILLANEFLPKGAMIVYLDGAHKKRQEEYADGRGRFQKLPLKVMVDETSASSSEIFAGAMQDNDRATIVGRRTFGKGLVQEQVDYADGSAARITIARYYTPLGRPLQKAYVSGQRDKYDSELIDRYNHGEYSSADSIKQADSLKTYVTAKGKILYGGGGVTPDVFIAIDGFAPTAYYLKLYNENLVFKFAQQYVDRNRQQINEIKDFKALDKFFEARPNIYMEFVSYAARAGFKPTDAELSENRKLLTTQLKAFIGRNTELQESAFFYYIWPLDPSMIAAFGK